MIDRIKKINHVRFLIAGDSSLTVEFGNAISTDISYQIRRFCDCLSTYPIKGILESVPTYRSVLIYYDPIVLTYSKAVHKLKSILKLGNGDEKSANRIIEIPVCYSSEFGEDLLDVADYAKMTVDEVIALHSKKDYLIYMLGFMPGFAYLGGLDTRLAMPRLDNPRTKVCAGAVGIGGEQTGVYPLDSPGGWRLIGKTPVKLYDSYRKNPVLYEAGDYIHFKPICKEEFFHIENLVKRGTFDCNIIKGELENGN